MDEPDRLAQPFASNVQKLVYDNITSDTSSSNPPVVCKSSVLDDTKFNRPMVAFHSSVQS